MYARMREWNIGNTLCHLSFSISKFWHPEAKPLKGVSGAVAPQPLGACNINSATLHTALMTTADLNWLG